MQFHSPDAEATRVAARTLAELLDGESLIVALTGPLGAGKTVFAKGVAEGLGIDPRDVSSPTYVIASEYRVAGGGRLVHADWYRVGSEDELEEAGLRDWLTPTTVAVIEWADRFPRALPQGHLAVEIAVGCREEARVLSAHGGERELLARWSERLSSVADIELV